MCIIGGDGNGSKGPDWRKLFGLTGVTGRFTDGLKSIVLEGGEQDFIFMRGEICIESPEVRLDGGVVFFTGDFSFIGLAQVTSIFNPFKVVPLYCNVNG